MENILAWTQSSLSFRQLLYVWRESVLPCEFIINVVLYNVYVGSTDGMCMHYWLLVFMVVAAHNSAASPKKPIIKLQNITALDIMYLY